MMNQLPRLTPAERLQDARERYTQVEISQAITWVMMTFDKFIFYTVGAHPEIAELWWLNFFVNEEDHATFARGRPLGHREGGKVLVEDWALNYIDSILAPQIILKNHMLLGECASGNMRITLMLESDLERNIGWAESLRSFPNWRVDGCADCGNPLATMRPKARKRKGGNMGDLSAVLDCGKCGHISEMGYMLDYDNRKPVDAGVSETWVDPGPISLDP